MAAIGLASAIVAMTPDRVIGVGNALPWHLPADMKHFRDRTRGHAVIMGRKTYESIGRPLPERLNIVVSRGGFTAPEGVLVVRSLAEAMASAGADSEPFIIGGGQIYAEAFQGFLKRIYVTLVETHLRGDAHFPPLPAGWELVSDEPRAADEKNAFAMRFQVYEKHS